MAHRSRVLEQNAEDFPFKIDSLVIADYQLNPRACAAF